MSEAVGVIEVDVDTTAQLVVSVPLPDTNERRILISENGSMYWISPSDLIKQFFEDNNIDHLLSLNKIS